MIIIAKCSPIADNDSIPMSALVICYRICICLLAVSMISGMEIANRLYASKSGDGALARMRANFTLRALQADRSSSNPSNYTLTTATLCSRSQQPRLLLADTTKQTFKLRGSIRTAEYLGEPDAVSFAAKTAPDL